MPRSDEDHSAQTPRGSAAQQVVVIVFLVVLIGLGVRGLIADDARFAWGMYGRDMAYNVTYEWLDADGRTRTHVPGNELRSSARRALYPQRADGQPRTRRTRYPAGTLRAQMRAYLRHLYEHHRPDHAVAVRLTWRYAYDYTGRGTGVEHIERLHHPVDAVPKAGEP